MAKGGSKLKTGCLGCLGLLVLLLVFVGINAALVVNRTGDPQPENQVLSSATAARMPADQPGPDGGAPTKPPAGQGWLILDLGQGDFELHKGEPGAGVVVRTSYDASIYEVTESSQTWPDSSWVYQLKSRRTISGLQAILAEFMGDTQAAKLQVYLPPDLPIELNVLVREGGLEGDLGGLWLTDVDLRYKKGGLDLDISEPLVAPVNKLAIHGRMGGGELSRLGNASPGRLSVSCAMGGMSVDLGGAWAGDCEASLDLRMGGMAVVVPDNIDLDEGGENSTGLRRSDPEVARPVLRLQKKVSMGEIEIQ